MPQPLSKLIHSKEVHITVGLPPEQPALCTQAMNVIATWAIIDRDLTSVITSTVPGKAAPIAQLFIDARADFPKRAMRNALTALLLDPNETPIFNAIMKKYETCYSLRNSLLAHWILASCRELPNAIIAINPETYVKINAENETVVDSMLRDISDRAREHLDGAQRLSEETVRAMMDVFKKHFAEMYAYRTKDLSDIQRDLELLLEMLARFQIAVRLRFLGVGEKARSQTLRLLSRKLGLSLPKAK